MSKIKNYIFSFLIMILLILLSVVFINIFYYYNLITENIYHFFQILSVIISVFTGSFILGRNSTCKGYFNGFIFGIIIITTLFLLSIIFSKVQFKQILYYFIILTSAILGGTIGIRKKKKL